MKKITFLTLILFVLGSSAAFAATSWQTDTATLGTAGHQLTIQLSNKVGMYYVADTATSGLGYVMATSHSSGTRTYGSSSGDAKIYYFDGTSQAPPTTTAPTGTQSADWTNWKAL